MDVKQRAATKGRWLSGARSRARCSKRGHVATAIGWPDACGTVERGGQFCGRVGGAEAASAPKTVVIDSARYPETAAHVGDAQAAGQPSVLTVDRAGVPARRAAAMRGTKSTRGKDRDEYPPAMFKEGGNGSSER